MTKKKKRSTRKKSRAKSEIKTVIFDMGNVLLKYDARKAARRFAKATEVPLLKLWLHFFVSPTEKAYTRGEISTREFYTHAKKALKLPVDLKTFSHYWNDIFTENPGMETLLKKLKKNYPLYLISNTNKLHYDHITKKFKLLRHFRRRFPSHEVGHRKPDREIYEKVLRKIRYRPEETVFIDDAPKFVRGARRVGMHAILFKNRKQCIHELKKLGVKV